MDDYQSVNDMNISTFSYSSGLLSNEGHSAVNALDWQSIIDIFEDTTAWEDTYTVDMHVDEVEGRYEVVEMLWYCSLNY